MPSGSLLGMASWPGAWCWEPGSWAPTLSDSPVPEPAPRSRESAALAGRPHAPPPSPPQPPLAPVGSRPHLIFQLAQETLGLHSPPPLSLRPPSRPFQAWRKLRALSARVTLPTHQNASAPSRLCPRPQNVLSASTWHPAGHPPKLYPNGMSTRYHDRVSSSKPRFSIACAGRDANRAVAPQLPSKAFLSLMLSG